MPRMSITRVVVQSCELNEIIVQCSSQVLAIVNFIGYYCNTFYFSLQLTTIKKLWRKKKKLYFNLLLLVVEWWTSDFSFVNDDLQRVHTRYGRIPPPLPAVFVAYYGTGSRSMSSLCPPVVVILIRLIIKEVYMLKLNIYSVVAVNNKYHYCSIWQKKKSLLLLSSKY